MHSIWGQKEKLMINNRIFFIIHLVGCYTVNLINDIHTFANDLDFLWPMRNKCLQRTKNKARLFQCLEKCVTYPKQMICSLTNFQEMTWQSYQNTYVGQVWSITFPFISWNLAFFTSESYWHIGKKRIATI